MSEYKRGIIKLLAIIALGVVISIWGVCASMRGDMGLCTVYECDIPIVTLSTKIDITVDDEAYCTVSGNIFRFVEDPLTMWDAEQNELAHAGDDYHFIAQDSHAITVNGTVTAEMVGLVELIGEKYDIYNPEGEKIAYAKFNGWDILGEIFDTEGNLIADYKCNLFREDFEVRISNDCKLDHKTVLMIICSYYSDKEAYN